MRKYLRIIALILGMIVTLFPLGTQKVSAQDSGSLATTIGFTVDPTQPGQLLQPESVIDELNNGVTQVYGPDGTLTSSVLDSQSATIPTSKGNILVDHAFTVPNESKVVNTGKEIDIYSKNILILKVISQNITQSNTSKIVSQNSIQPATATNAWVEQARNIDSNGNDHALSNIDYFSTDWIVPAVPNTTTTQVDFIFNAFQSDHSAGIIQPVLEWNQIVNGQHSGRWTGAAWYMSNGNLIRDPTSPVTNISVGDSINGSLSYDYDSSQWVIIFNDVTKAQISLGVNDLGMTTTGMHPYLAYEMWSPDPTQPTCDCSSYVPRDCTFTNIITKYTGNSFNVNWAPFYSADNYPNGIPDINGVITYPPCLSGLQVVGASQGTSSITLKTTYTTALSVSTNAATNITNDQVTLNGTLNGLGSASSVNTAFVYATDSYWNANNNNYQNQTPLNQNINSPGTYTFNLIGLSPNTTYHYAAEVQGNGTMFGSDQTFTTSSVITDPASNITATSAVLNASLTGGNNFIRGFVIDTTSHPSTPSGAFDTHVGTGGYDLWRWYEKPWYSLSNPWQMMSDLMCTGTISSTDLTFFGLQYGWTMPYPLYYRGDTCECGGTIGSRDLTELGYYYGTTVTYTPFSTGSFSVNLASPKTYYNGASQPWGSTLTLTSGTTYYYRAFTYDSLNGWTWGNEVSFTTN